MEENVSFPALKTKNFPARGPPDPPADSLCCINNNIRIREQILIFGGSRETQKLEGNMRKNEEGARRKLRIEQGERTKIRERPLMIWGEARRKSRKKNFSRPFYGEKKTF